MATLKITDSTTRVAAINASDAPRIVDALRWDRWWTDSFSGSVEFQDGQVVILTPTDTGRFMISWFDENSQQRVVLSGNLQGFETVWPGAEPLRIRLGASFDPGETAQMLQTIACSEQLLHAALASARRQVAFFEDVLVIDDE